MYIYIYGIMSISPWRLWDGFWCGFYHGITHQIFTQIHSQGACHRVAARVGCWRQCPGVLLGEIGPSVVGSQLTKWLKHQKWWLKNRTNGDLPNKKGDFMGNILHNIVGMYWRYTLLQNNIDQNSGFLKNSMEEKHGTEMARKWLTWNKRNFSGKPQESLFPPSNMTPTQVDKHPTIFHV